MGFKGETMRWTVWLLACLTSAGACTATVPDKPNIILLFADDLGWTDLACFGSEFYETPNLDRLCGEGMKFTCAYANAGNCAPSRACLMSGQYVPRHGIYTVGSKHRFDDKKKYPNNSSWNERKLLAVDNAETLPPAKVTIAEGLRAAGYATAMFGKWHLGDRKEATQPVGQGFDTAHFRTGGSHWDVKVNPRPDPMPPKGTYRSDWMTDRAIEFIEAHRERPFFLYVPEWLVHVPLEAKQETIAKYKAKKPSEWHHHPVYAAMIEHLDCSFGRIIDRVDQLGLAEKTLVVFFSDNGGVASNKRHGLEHHGSITSNHPLRGMKGMLYEGGIRVPMIARWKGVIAPGSTCDVPVIGTDYFPTFLEAASAAPPPADTQPLDGESLLALMTGQSESLRRQAIFWHMPGYLPGRQAPATAMHAGNWKLIKSYEEDSIELYNLAQDISEEHDLAAKLPEKAAELHAALKAWVAETGARIPPQNPKYKPTKRARAGKRE